MFKIQKPQNLFFEFFLRRFLIRRSHFDFSLTFINLLSRTLLQFLIVFTFHKSIYNDDFDELSYNQFIIAEEFLGSYSYKAIGTELHLTKVLKKFSYFKRIMSLEVFHNTSALFQIFKYNVFRITNIDFKNLHFKFKVNFFYKNLIK